MLIEHLVLQHFRNYDFLDIDLKDQYRIALIGSNAQGKSNFMEAIYTLSFANSFRSSQANHLIQWDQNQARIKCQCRLQRGDDFLLGFEVHKNGKRLVQHNHTYQKRLADYIGYLKIVFFSQADLDLIKGQPARRRAYLDQIIVQVRPGYYALLQKYNRVMKHRNSLLKSFKKQRKTASDQLEELELWDIQLSQMAAKIISQRKQTLTDLIPLIQQSQTKMSGLNESVSIDYRSQTETADAAEILEQLFKKREQDIFRGQTSVGPHRDDLVLKLEQRELKAFGSQGQIRTAALAMKVAELHYIQQEFGEYPLLLLDDVFSELDIQRQQLLIQQISIESLQTFITTTHLDNAVQRLLSDQGLILHVREGQVIKA